MQKNTNSEERSPKQDDDTVETTIGQSIVFTGDLKGKENILINGTVEGLVECLENHVRIGEHGNVVADVRARQISVEGNIKGNLSAKEQVIVHASGKVVGDIRSPRVVLVDGCQFKGNVDMDGKNIRNLESKGIPKPTSARNSIHSSMLDKPKFPSVEN